jgi:hypothetical protein
MQHLQFVLHLAENHQRLLERYVPRLPYSMWGYNDVGWLVCGWREGEGLDGVRFVYECWLMVWFLLRLQWERGARCT